MGEEAASLNGAKQHEQEAGDPPFVFSVCESWIWNKRRS